MLQLCTILISLSVFSFLHTEDNYHWFTCEQPTFNPHNTGQEKSEALSELYTLSNIPHPSPDLPYLKKDSHYANIQTLHRALSSEQNKQNEIINTLDQKYRHLASYYETALQANQNAFHEKLETIRKCYQDLIINIKKQEADYTYHQEYESIKKEYRAVIDTIKKWYESDKQKAHAEAQHNSDIIIEQQRQLQDIIYNQINAKKIALSELFANLKQRANTTEQTIRNTINLLMAVELTARAQYNSKPQETFHFQRASLRMNDASETPGFQRTPSGKLLNSGYLQSLNFLTSPTKLTELYELPPQWYNLIKRIVSFYTSQTAKIADEWERVTNDLPAEQENKFISCIHHHKNNIRSYQFLNHNTIQTLAEYKALQHRHKTNINKYSSIISSLNEQLIKIEDPIIIEQTRKEITIAQAALTQAQYDLFAIEQKYKTVFESAIN